MNEPVARRPRRAALPLAVAAASKGRIGAQRDDSRRHQFSFAQAAVQRSAAAACA